MESAGAEKDMSDDASPILDDTYDAEQSAMMAEQCILVDESDQQIGSASKVDCHLGSGKLHRAFSVMLFDSNDRLLIQKRAASKITFPSVWANSCCSHPLDVVGENEAQDGLGAKRAAIRKLEQELGIAPEGVPLENFQFVSRMLYKARADSKWVEHELDHILFIRADVDVNPNPNEIDEYRWVSQSELEELVTQSPENGELIAPWFQQIKLLFLDNWWDHLDNMTRFVDGTIHEVGDVTMREDSLLLDALQHHRIEVEKRIREALSKTKNERLQAAMLHLIDGGGKRLRAILPRLVAEAAGQADDGLYDLGAAIEIIHNFTLVHDDIMDNDEIRRGRPAVHIAFDHPTAINAGDAMLAVSFEVLSESQHISDQHLRKLTSIIGQMVRNVSEGQQMDMDFGNRDSVSESEYLTMISGKTAAMFTTSSRTGALLSGASEEVIETLSQWGENVGLCFQLMDDLIDATGDSETLGKPACSDVIEGKRTLIAIHALNQDETLLPTFHRVFASGDENTSREDLDTIISELESVGSIEYARNRAMEHHSIAHKRLDSLPPSKAISVLRELTDWQLIRIA
jgi:geranylgeranyl diphosphate synthase type I